MKVLIFIHGGESFKTHEEYERFLHDVYIDWQSAPWSPEVKKSWKYEVAKKWYDIGGVVYMPDMPDKIDAKYSEWKIIFEGILAKLSSEDEVTLVGTSLGGCFLLKYFSEQHHKNYFFVISSEAEIVSIPLVGKSLSKSSYENGENAFSKVQEIGMPTAGQKTIKIHQIHLLAACISEGDFTTPENYDVLQSLTDRVHIWHAEDDRVVPITVGHELTRALPLAQSHFFSSEKGYGHFYGLERIEDIELILYGGIK